MLNDNKTRGPYWTRNWIEAMWRFTNENFVDFDSGSVDFEALGKEEFEFRKALFFRNFKNSPRAKETFDAAKEEYQKKIENGNKGGRPRKEKEETLDNRTGNDEQPASPRGAAAKHPVEMPSTEQLYDFANAEGLDEADARDWFEMTVVERDGNDRNGNPIVNWKGACKRFCTARAKSRNRNGENQ